MIFPDRGAGCGEQPLADAWGVCQRGRGPLDQRLHDVCREFCLVHPAGHQPLHLLPQHAVIRHEPGLVVLDALGTERAFDDLIQRRRQDPITVRFVISCPPAERFVPVVQTLQEVRAQQFVIIGQGEAAGRCGVERRDDDAGVLLRQLAAAAVERFLQRCFVIRRLCFGGCRAERADCVADLDSLRVPAEESTPAEHHARALLRRQPAQRVVRLLGGNIADRCGLRIVGKAPAIGEVAVVVGRDQLGVSVEGDDALWVLFGRNIIAARDHAQGRIGLRAPGRIPRDIRIE